MRTIYLIALSILCWSNTIAQAPCALVNIFESVKKIDFTSKRSLTSKKFSSFDFITFRPIKDKTLPEEFEISYTANGEIEAIIYFGTSKFISNYKLLVFDFNDYRILVLQHLIAGKYLFTPIAIVMFKTSGENYAINFSKRLGKEDACCGSSYYSEFPAIDVNDISSITSLSKDLFPTQIVQLSALQIVISSDIYYEKDNRQRVTKEAASFFLSPTYYNNLKINPKMCMSEIIRICQVPPDLIVDMIPNMHGFEEIPLWLFGGSHDYKKCN